MHHVGHLPRIITALVLLLEPWMRDDIQMAITENGLRILNGMSWLETWSSGLTMAPVAEKAVAHLLLLVRNCRLHVHTDTYSYSEANVHVELCQRFRLLHNIAIWTALKVCTRVLFVLWLLNKLVMVVERGDFQVLVMSFQRCHGNLDVLLTSSPWYRIILIWLKSCCVSHKFCTPHKASSRLWVQ